MLHTDEVDDDYFTPAANTTLANIFGGTSRQDTNKDNESLKYTPPKKPECTCIKSAEYNTALNQNKGSKPSECILAYALTAFEWEGNQYLRRGKLGFAILKSPATDTYNIVLYDSNKTIISNFTVHTQSCGLFVMTSSPQSIAYFDNSKTYWSLHGKEEEITKIVNILKNITVQFENTSTHQTPIREKNVDPENLGPSICDMIEPTLYGEGNEKESDTDLFNKKTKASILHRMANMGHSVLPTNTTFLTEKSSDSSDSPETSSPLPKIRPKSSKIISKRNNLEKNIPEISNSIETYQTAKTPIKPSASTSTLYTIVDEQLVPLSNTSVVGTNINNSNSQLNLFITEQRINNNELRINVSRTTDKIDQVLDILKSTKDKQNDGTASNFQIEIMQKLLNEYETKIKNYEQKLAAESRTQTITLEDKEQPFANNTKQLTDLQIVISEKDKTIIELNNQLEKQELLLKEFNDLKEAYISKDNEMKKIQMELLEWKNEKNNRSRILQNKIKEIMNDLFHTVTTEIDDSEMYSGDNVKKIIGSLIKSSTMQYLKDCNSGTILE